MAVVIRHRQQPDRVLAVMRPPDDPELPDVWGLPASTLRPGEHLEDSVRRTGTEKLGVDLNVGDVVRRGSTERRDYRLEMTLLEATIDHDLPSVPQPHPEVTQYVDWQWAEPAAFIPAADLGSLCCRLFLETVVDRLD